MDALFFDFDGVIVDSEPVHLMGFRQVIEPLGITISTPDYYEKYLGYDDHDAFVVLLREHGRPVDEQRIAELTAAKSRLVKTVFAESIQPLPGALALIAAAAADDVPMAICSGALREEVELSLRTVGAADYFRVLIAAKDVTEGKPSPQGYRLARDRLAEAVRRDIDPARCIVFEDSPAGIEAGQAAGMKVVGITNSCDADALDAADLVVAGLTQVSLASLEALL